VGEGKDEGNPLIFFKDNTRSIFGQMITLLTIPVNCTK